jgi:hypothetical protein
MVRRHREAARLRRILIVGGAGFFGASVAQLLRAEGADPVVAGRSGDLVFDAEDAASVRSALRARDVILDAAGPFQARSTTLVETAIEVGADVVDLNDSLAYAKRIAALDGRARRRDVAVVSSCSAVSTVAAVLVQLSGIESPTCVSALVAPASRRTAHAGTVRALLASVGRPIEVLREGRLTGAIGWREMHDFRLPRRRGRLIESALALTLPEAHPTLRSVDTWTDTGMPGASALLSLAARSAALRWAAGRVAPVGIAVARILGADSGAFAVEVVGPDARVSRLSLTSPRRSYLIACAPAALVARDLAADRFAERGLVPAHRHVDGRDLVAYLARLGISLEGPAIESTA